MSKCPGNLVTCAKLRRPHHADTHISEDRVNGMACRDQFPAPEGSRCWQCLPVLDREKTMDMERQVREDAFRDALSELVEAKLEITRLQKEGSPGVMHEVDRAFYDLTVKERNLANTEVEHLKAVCEEQESELGRHHRDFNALREIVHEALDAPGRTLPESREHFLNALKAIRAIVG